MSALFKIACFAKAKEIDRAFTLPQGGSNTCSQEIYIRNNERQYLWTAKL
jgi:hypothetical protein